MTTFAYNRKARYNYQLLDRLEAGIVLSGAEVKSVRTGRVSLLDAYVRIKNSEAWLTNAYIAPYQAKQKDYDPRQDRKLLLKKNELTHLKGRLASKNLTIVPLKVYTKRRLLKLEIALVKGKKRFEKKAGKKRQEIARRTRQEIKESGY